MNSRNARPPLAREHRQRGGDDGLGVLARIGLRQVARHVEQRLRRVVERRLPASGGRVGEAQLALVEREVAADGERRRREDPRASRLGDLLARTRRRPTAAMRCSCQPACVTSTQRIHATPGAASSAPRVVGLAPRPARQRASCAAASRRALRAVGDVLAALGEEPELGGEAIERGGHLVQRGAEPFLVRGGALRDLAGRLAERQAQLS